MFIARASSVRDGGTPRRPMWSRTISRASACRTLSCVPYIDTEPVDSQPLALCDGRTVEPDELVVFEIRYRDRTGESYFAKHAPRHGWWWYPAMTRNEALLIKQWDSAGGLARSGGARSDAAAGGDRAPCTFSFLTAFRDADRDRDRQSIEVRYVLLSG